MINKQQKALLTRAGRTQMPLDKSLILAGCQTLGAEGLEAAQAIWASSQVSAELELREALLDGALSGDKTAAKEFLKYLERDNEGTSKKKAPRFG